MQRSPLLRQRWIMHLGVALSVCVPASAHGQHPGTAHTDEPRSFVVERELSPGGGLDLVVNAGDVRIVRNQQPGQIRLEVGIMDRELDPLEAQKQWLQRMNVDGSHASIALELPKARVAGLVTIYVPPVTSLAVKMRAGKLTVEAVKGDKDLRLRSGTLSLREADPAAYQHVTANVRLGELTDSVFHGKAKGLWGRTLVMEGKGQYQLLLHVGNGELILTPEQGDM